MSKPWLETWRFWRRIGDVWNVQNLAGNARLGVVPVTNELMQDTECVAHLAAAAPEMCRALLRSEWCNGYLHHDDGTPDQRCPCCLDSLSEDAGHAGWCILDQALCKAGLDTQEKRDAARKEMGI